MLLLLPLLLTRVDDDIFSNGGRDDDKRDDDGLETKRATVKEAEAVVVDAAVAVAAADAVDETTPATGTPDRPVCKASTKSCNCDGGNRDNTLIVVSSTTPINRPKIKLDSFAAAAVCSLSGGTFIVV